MDVDSKMKLQQYSLVLGTFLEIGVILAESVMPLTSKSLTVLAQHPMLHLIRELDQSIRSGIFQRPG